MTVTLLGSGGWIPSARRETCCALVREGSEALLVDAGTGVSRLVERPGLLEGVRTLEIVLTHFHLDHVTGLSYLPALAPRKRVWAPGAWLYGRPSEAILERLLGPPLFASGVAGVVDEVAEIEPGGVRAGAADLQVRAQERHPQPTVALRAGDDWAYCTDTAWDPATAEFAAGVRTLFHEAWHAAPSTDDPTHTAAGEAAGLAAEGGVGDLVLIHVSPVPGEDERLAAPAREVFGATVVGQDWLER